MLKTALSWFKLTGLNHSLKCTVRESRLRTIPYQIILIGSVYLRQSAQELAIGQHGEWIPCIYILFFLKEVILK